MLSSWGKRERTEAPAANLADRRALTSRASARGDLTGRVAGRAGDSLCLDFGQPGVEVVVDVASDPAADQVLEQLAHVVGDSFLLDVGQLKGNRYLEHVDGQAEEAAVVVGDVDGSDAGQTVHRGHVPRSIFVRLYLNLCLIRPLPKGADRAVEGERQSLGQNLRLSRQIEGDDDVDRPAQIPYKAEVQIPHVP